jgi:hypothetical protein
VGRTVPARRRVFLVFVARNAPAEAMTTATATPTYADVKPSVVAGDYWRICDVVGADVTGTSRVVSGNTVNRVLHLVGRLNDLLMHPRRTAW